MKCPRCQSENDERLKFCEDCGAPLARACPNCGAQIRPDKKFCGECGASLDAAPAPRFGTPDQYTPKHLAEKILTSRAAVEGERKQVTVLFADLKGSMELLADRDPEQACALLDPVLEKMMEAVHRYEGTVNEVRGDGIMALFGAPLALEDHAVRACYAALAMQSAIQAYNEQLRRSLGVEMQIRVGLNSGEVVVRAIGNDLHMDYTAVGQTVHLAARMEQLSAPGTTRLTAETLRLAEGFIKVTPLGLVPVKGLDRLVEVFALAGAGAAHSRLQAAATRGLTRFVGRSAELAQMFSALERSHAGHGEVVALVGEPGVGKSRLVWEFIRSYRTQGWLVLESASISYGKANAYGPVIDLLKSYFQIEDRDDTRRVREKATGKLLTLDEALKPHLVPLLALLDVVVDDESWKLLDPVQKRLRTLDACKRLILRESQVQPLLVVFEDLHWIDSETQALLDALVESLPTARLLLLVSFRPEYQPRWTSKASYTQLRIDPLTGESAEELLRTLLGTDPSLKPLARFLIERTEGNPLYFEESVRALVETGELQGSRGAYRLTAPLTSIQVPATVQAILAARIDRLTPDDKHLLQAAAVVGKDVPHSLLEAIVELSEDALRQHLGTLQAAEFLYEKSLFPDLEYTFKHALTHEVAYVSMLHERRKALHAQIVAAIERLYADRLSEHVERLAHHAQRGQLWDQAARYSRHAGNRALHRMAAREALAHFDQARTALRQLSESRERTEQLIELCFEQRNALWPLGEFSRAGEVLNEARALAEGLGDERRLGRALGYLAPLQSILGEHVRAIEAGERARAIAEALDELGLRIVANLYLGQALWWSGESRRAVEPLRAAIALVKGAPLGERFGLAGLPAVLPRFLLALVLAEQGEFSEALGTAAEGLRIAQAAGHPYSEVWAQYALGYAHVRRGDFAQATRPLEQALAVCRGMEIRLPLSYVALSLGSAYLWSGRAADAVPLLEEAVGVYTAIRIVGLRSWFITSLAEAYLALGWVAKAREQAEEAAALARRQQERISEAWALKLLGDVHAHEPAESEQAGDANRQALALATELGMLPLVAHCHFGLGKLYRKRNKREQAAREHFTTATTMYREMDMQFWLEQAEVEMKELT